MQSKIKELTEMKECLISALKSEIGRGLDTLDTKEAGEVVDMIKDLAEAEKCCYEACYYKTVIEAMGYEDSEENGRMGYNNRRYSNGEYAPSGRGQVYGYRPYMDQEPYIREYLNGRMGYSGSGNNSSSQGQSQGQSQGNSRSGMTDSEGGSRYGKAYNDYQSSRKYYTKTNSKEAKEEMEAHASEHMGDTISTIREIWKNADTDLKHKMKKDLTNLVNEMDA